MYIDCVPNRNSNPTYLIRESKRVNGKPTKRTLANITKLPLPIIEQIKLLLKGGTVVQAFDDMFDIQSTLPHGHV
ncbi:MAG: IS1634 family transposase, partial [Bacteroidetes bacterium]|nr:IS1634 family transposase [Bacteroidota bacterium]